MRSRVSKLRVGEGEWRNAGKRVKGNGSETNRVNFYQTVIDKLRLPVLHLRIADLAVGVPCAQSEERKGDKSGTDESHLVRDIKLETKTEEVEIHGTAV